MGARPSCMGSFSYCVETFSTGSMRRTRTASIEFCTKAARLDEEGRLWLQIVRGPQVLPDPLSRRGSHVTSKPCGCKELSESNPLYNKDSLTAVGRPCCANAAHSRQARCSLTLPFEVWAVVSDAEGPLVAQCPYEF